MRWRGCAAAAHARPVVLRDEPGLERREEERGGNPSEEAANEEDIVVGPMLCYAAGDVCGAVAQARPLAAPLVGEASDNCPDDHGGAESRDEEAADLASVVSVVLVESVDVRTLEPISRCG